jgi:hypothetical protein
MTTRIPVSKPERMKRGSFPPYLALGDAFELIRSIYEQGGGQASYDLLSRLTGNSSSSSSFVKKAGVLKLYGLVSEQNGGFVLTEQGSAIAAPVSEEAGSGAKKAAFLCVPAFAKLFERHKGKLLPADEFLKNILEQDVGVPQELSSDWVRAFKESAKAAGLLFIRADGKIQILETPSLEVDRQAARNDTQDGALSQQATIVSAEVSHRVVPPSGATQLQPITASGNNTRFEFSDGRVAEFSIPFGINAKDAKRLKGFLKGLEFIIDSAVIGDEGPSS